MVTTPMHVLLVEDNPGDVRLIQEALAEAGGPPVELAWVETLREAEEALAGPDGSPGPEDDGDGPLPNPFAAVLLDLGLPDGSGLATLSRVQTADPRAPVVVLTGTDDDELAVEAVKAGAQDYLVKGEVTGRELARYLRYARERKRMEEERRQLLEREREARREAQEASQQAQQAMQERDRVLRTVVHDLRSPLAGIRLGAGAALRGDSIPPETERVLSAIRREGERMGRLLEDLLEVATVEGGHSSLRLEPCRVPPLVGEVTELLQAAADEHGIALRKEVPENLPLIRADRDRLAQVLSNLLSNAVRFTPAEGTIVVRAAGEVQAVQISVADTGPGIPEEERDSLLDRFWDPDRPPRTKGGGTGLGLPIARAIVEAHEGRIWVDSEPGRGSTFHFTVPVAQEGEPWTPLD